jgi:hypothetical protein
MLDHTGPRTLKGMYIGGQWITPAGTFDDMNPSTGDVWAKAPDGGAAELTPLSVLFRRGLV